MITDTSPERVAALTSTVQEVSEALLAYGALAPMRPERYWQGEPKVISIENMDNPHGLPIEVDFEKKRKNIFVTIGERALDEYVADYSEETGQAVSDITRLFIGYGLVHDLAIRALAPERADDFIEHITRPNGLYNELLGSGLIDDNDSDEIMREFFIGDDDRIAKVNVARFAVGAVCEAINIVDTGFRQRITGMFRPEFSQFLEYSKAYRAMAQSVFDQTHEKANQMLVEHIRDFDVAAAFPKQDKEVRDFVTIYS